MISSKLSKIKQGTVYHKPDKTGQSDAQNGSQNRENALHATHDQNGSGFPIQVFNALLSQQVDEGAALERLHSPERCEKTVKGLRNSPVTCEKTVREANSQSRHDMVNHPAHYCQGGIECIDAIQSAVTGLSGMQAVCAGNVIKYTWRYQFKNGAEDLRKARFYLDRLIRIVEGR